MRIKLSLALLIPITQISFSCSQVKGKDDGKKTLQKPASAPSAIHSSLSSNSTIKSPRPACCKGAPSRSKLAAQAKKSL